MNSYSPIFAFEDISGSLPRHPTKKYTLRSLNKINTIAVHTTDIDTTVQAIAKYDIGPNHISATGNPAITYSEMVTKDGKGYHTLPWEEIAWHVGTHNKYSLGIAMIYKCSNAQGVDVYAPKEEQLEATILRCAGMCLQLGLEPNCIVGHRELKTTGWYFDENGHVALRKTCPGMLVDMFAFRKEASKSMQSLLKVTGFYSGTVDGSFGPKSKKALVAYRLANP